jgi:hypothetical protein
MDVENGHMRGRGKHKRAWSPQEDQVLVESLHYLSTDPQWKADTGFKNGYLLRLEEMIRDKIPNSGLKANPHIESRIKLLKQKYNGIMDMLKMSGFKWDSTRNIIACEKSAYDQHCQVHFFYKARKRVVIIFRYICSN